MPQKQEAIITYGLNSIYFHLRNKPYGMKVGSWQKGIWQRVDSLNPRLLKKLIPYGLKF
jgi:hypothetical protein